MPSSEPDSPIEQPPVPHSAPARTGASGSAYPPSSALDWSNKSRLSLSLPSVVEREAEEILSSLARGPTGMPVGQGFYGGSDSRRPHAARHSSYHLVQDQDGVIAEEEEENDLTATADGRLTPYLLKLSLVAGCSGLLFGWDTAIVSGMLVALKTDLGHPLTAGEQELVVSATTIGAIFGSLIAGKASDWMGRKKVIVMASVLFLLGSLEQTASMDVPQLVLGRAIVGLAVGIAAAVCPNYLGEMAPPSLRGKIVGTNSLLITGGQVIAYLVNAALFPVAHGWRWMVLASALPAVVQLVGLISLDESPRWLVNKGRYVEARRVLKRIYPMATDDVIEKEVDRIDSNLKISDTPTDSPSVRPSELPAEEQEDEDSEAQGMLSGGNKAPASPNNAERRRSKWKLLFGEPANRKALLLACGLQAFQQATGFNSLMYFGSRILMIAGPPFDRNPTAFATFIALANFAGTCVAMRFIDTWGRRKLLLWTTAGMCISLALLSASFGAIGGAGTVVDPGNGTTSNSTSAGSVFNSVKRRQDSLHDLASTAEPLIARASHQNVFAILSLLLIILFTIMYALGQGLIPWLVLSEVFSGQVRSLGSSLASCCNWAMNLLWSATYLSLVEAVGGPAKT